MNRLRRQAAEQAKVSNDHQALDMVGVSLGERLPNGMRQAAHLRLARPEPVRQRGVLV